MSSKEIWFIRHAETVTPGDYDFGLSRKGKRNTRLLGWYMAAQNIVSPVIILHFAAQRAETMADILQDEIDKEPSAKTILAHIPTQGTGAAQFFSYMFALLKGMDSIADHCDGLSPSTLVIITHKQYETGFDLLRFLLAAQRGKELADMSLEEFDRNLPVGLGRDIAKHDKGHFGNCEFARLRFPINAWQELAIGSGDTVEETTIDHVRSTYRKWRNTKHCPA